MQWRALASTLFSPAAFRSSGRIPSLDGLRAISITLVLLSHAQGTPGFPVRWFTGSFGNIGHLGVRIFFVISGFLITSLLVQELEASGSVSLKGFYLRRFFRICPAFYTYIGLLAASSYVLLRKGDLLHALTYTMNYHPDRSWWLGHLWSLSVEEQFYLLWPAVLAFGGRRRAIQISLLCVVLSPLTKFSTRYLLPSADIGEYFNMLADTLAMGCLLALCRGWLGRQPVYLRMLNSRVVMCAIPVSILITNYLLPHTRFSWLCGELVLNASIAAGIDWCIRNCDAPFGKVLNMQPLVGIGVLSYSLYLWQQPFLNPEFHSWAAKFPVNMILSVCAALLSFLCVERPFLMLRTRLAKHTAPRATAPNGVNLQRTVRAGTD